MSRKQGMGTRIRRARGLAGALPGAFALLAGPLGPVAGQTGEPRVARVDEIFTEWTRLGSPGAATVVLREGEVVHRAGYGLADLEHGVPIGPSTVFDVASVSKHFTAFAVLALADEGRLSLDDPIREHVPELPPYHDDVTLRHLLHHTGGVRDWVELLYLGGWRFDDVIGVHDILTLAAGQRALNFRPGTEHLYSNTGYNLLAETVARVSGRSFGSFMRERAFGPLGMERTRVQEDHGSIVRGRARSYEPGDDGYRELLNATSAVGSSSVLTTVDDMATWVRALERGTVGGPGLFERMALRGVLENGDTISYAYGLTVQEHRGLRSIGHGGSWRGYRSQLLHYPDQGLTVAVLANVSSFDAGGTARRVAEVFLEDRMAAAPEDRRPAARREPERAPLSEEELQGLEGTYRSPELGTDYAVVRQGRRLVLRHRKHPDVEMTHVGGLTFVMDGVRGRQTAEFQRAEGGAIAGYHLAGSRFRGVWFGKDPPG